MQNTSEISHPGNKQNSSCPWEANTGREILSWTKATAESDRLDWVWPTQGCGYQEVAWSWCCYMEYGMALFESKMEKKIKKKKKPSTAYSPGLPSCEYLLTRSIFTRQKESSKESSNNSLKMDKHCGQASPAGFRHFSACIPWTVQPSQERLYVPQRWLGHSSQCHIIDVVLTAFREVNVGGENSHRVLQLFPLARHTP